MLANVYTYYVKRTSMPQQMSEKEERLQDKVEWGYMHKCGEGITDIGGNCGKVWRVNVGRRE